MRIMNNFIINISSFIKIQIAAWNYQVDFPLLEGQKKDDFERTFRKRVIQEHLELLIPDKDALTQIPLR